MRKLFLLVILFLALSTAGWSEPRDTHFALCELYFPQFLTESEAAALKNESWQAFEADPNLAFVWRQLDGLEELEESARWNRLGELPDLVQLSIRQRYVTWLYQGERGWRWAGIEPPDNSPSRRSPMFPKLKSSPLSLRGDDIRVEENLDFLIVGSGPAGAVLGHELSAAGFKVMIVEKGSFVLPEAIDTRDIAELKIGGGAVPTVPPLILVRNGQAVGGGSAVNVDLAFSPLLDFVQERFESWRERGLIRPEQWKRQEVASAYAWVEETLGTRTPALAEVNANNDILHRGAEAVGLTPCLYDLNTVAGGDPSNNKLSATNRLLLPAMTRPENPLIVLPDFEVEKIFREDDRVVSVTGRFQDPWSHPKVWVNPYRLSPVRGKTYQIKAERFIICAGAQGTAALLLRSEIGGNAVGKGVVLHPSMPFVGKFEEPINAHLGTDSTIYAVDPDGMLYECMSAGPDYVASIFMGTGAEIGERVKDYKFFGGFGVLLVDEPNPSNQVRLNSEGEVEIVYSLSVAEKSRLAKGVLKALKIMLAAGAKEVYLPSAETLLGSSTPGHVTPVGTKEKAEAAVSALKFVPGATVLTAAHMQSSCKLGTSPETSVVDSDLKVWGTDNLYLCDSSVFPTSVGANPMQTIYTVAKMTADRFSAQ